MPQKKLKILLVSEYFYPKIAGGEVWAYDICTELSKRGHDVTVITSQLPGTAAEETLNEIKILRPVPCGNSLLSRKLSSIRLERFVKKHLLDGMRKQKDRKSEYDIIHVTAYALNVKISKTARKLGIPCITSIHAYFGDDWMKISKLGFIMRILERRAITADESGCMHVPSEYVRRRILSDTKKDTVVIHNWLPESFPAPKKLPKRTLLFVGSLEPIKNPLACIDAAEKLNAPLIYIGKGSLKDAVEKRANASNVDVKMLGEMSKEETKAYMAGSSLVMIPSITESFSLVAIEALAQGTPISATPVGIIPELPNTAFPPKTIPSRFKDKKRIISEFSRTKLVGKFENQYKIIIKNHLMRKQKN